MSTTLLDRVAQAQEMLPAADPSGLPALAAEILDGQLTDPGDIAARLDAMRCHAVDLDGTLAWLEERRDLRKVFDSMETSQAALRKARDKETGAQMEFERDTKIRGEKHAVKMREVRIERSEAEGAVKAAEEARHKLIDSAPKELRERRKELLKERIRIREHIRTREGIVAKDRAKLDRCLAELGRLLSIGREPTRDDADAADNDSRRNAEWRETAEAWITSHKPEHAVADWTRSAAVEVVSSQGWLRKSQASLEEMVAQGKANDQALADVLEAMLRP